MSEPANPQRSIALGSDLRRIADVALLKDVVKRFNMHEDSTLATSFAYYWTFAIPPLLILVTMIGVLIDKATNIQLVENIRELIEDRAEPDFQPLLLRLLDQAVTKVGSGAASFGVLFTTVLALWSSASAIAILMLGFNRAYEVAETRSWIRQKAISLGLTLMLVAMVPLAFVLLVFGQRIGDWVADRLDMGSAFNTVWEVSRWPIAILGMMLALSVVYRVGPNVALPFRWFTVGAVVATVLWLVLVAGFGIYLGFSNPGSAYGVAGSVIVLLVFLNLTGLVFFLGGEIDAALWRTHGGPQPPIADA